MATPTADDLETVLALYEEVARANRPDWDQFIVEAQDDPAEIAWEVCDVAAHAGLDTDADGAVDALFKVAQQWVRQLTPPKPRLGVPFPADTLYDVDARTIGRVCPKCRALVVDDLDLDTFKPATNRYAEHFTSSPECDPR